MSERQRASDEDLSERLNAWAEGELERDAIQEEAAFPPLEAYADEPKAKVRGLNGRAAAPELPPVQATPFVWIDPRQIAPRPWLYNRHYMRGMVSVTAGIGGAGKTSLLFVEALSLACGRDFFNQGQPVDGGAQAVWLHNEDPPDEIQRRIAAICIHFRIDPSDFGGRLYVTSSHTTPIVVAQELQGGGKLLVPTNHGQQIMDQIRAKNIALFVLDPFVSAHRVSENDNVMIEGVMKILRGLAHETQCALELAHHFRKLNGQEPSADDVRGASSIVGASRSVRVLAQMTSAEAEEMDLQPEERKSYVWLQNVKANMAPPLLMRKWFHLESVDLDNAQPPYGADSVGVPAPWQPPGKSFDLTAPEFRAVRLAFREVPNPLNCLRYDVRSSGWAGKVIATAIDLDPDDSVVRNKMKALIERWLHVKRLRVVKLDDHKQARKVAVLEWVLTEEE